MEIYSTIKINELLKHTTGIDLTLILYEKKRHLKRLYILYYTIYRTFSNDKTIVMENRSVVGEGE